MKNRGYLGYTVYAVWDEMITNGFYIDEAEEVYFMRKIEQKLERILTAGMSIVLAVCLCACGGVGATSNIVESAQNHGNAGNPQGM